MPFSSPQMFQVLYNIYFRFRCLRPLCCPCGPLSPCLLVLAAHSLASLALLGLSCLLISDTEAALETLTSAIDTKDRWAENIGSSGSQ